MFTVSLLWTEDIERISLIWNTAKTRILLHSAHIHEVMRITLSTIAEECTPARNKLFQGYKSWVAWFKELRSSFEQLKKFTLSRSAFLTFVEIFDFVPSAPNIYDEGRYISLTPWSTTVE